MGKPEEARGRALRAPPIVVSWRTIAAVDVALTRDVSRSIARCELTHRDREPIDYERAVSQQQAYCDGLVAKGFLLLRLPADEACPDGCFVEDTAVVLDEVAVITMPGAPSRRPELSPIEAALRVYRPLESVRLPATLDGGDVLKVGRRLYVGLSSRTNREGIEALRTAITRFGYEVEGVPVSGCLHLKTAVTALDDETLLLNPLWTSGEWLGRYRLIQVAPEEPEAANVLRVKDEVWAHPAFPRTMDLLGRHGFRVATMDISEFVKAEAGLTCKSLLFRQIGALV